MIEAEGLVKEYDGFPAVNGISFSIEKGRIVGLLGPNGAGKSTTIRMLCSYMPPSSGRVSVNGLDAVKDDMKVKRLIGYLPEDNPLYWDMTPLEYLEFCSKLRAMDPGYARRRIKEVSGICSITEVLVKPISELSKGYRQRLGLAQAILHDPPILLLDEPTSGLDPNQIRDIRELIKGLKEEKTIVLSTHIMQEVQALCQRVIIINRGRIVADGSPEELSGMSGSSVYKIEIEGPGDTVYRELADLDTVENLEYSEGIYRINNAGPADPRRDIYELSVRNSWPILTMYKSRESMEDIFRKLTSDGAGDERDKMRDEDEEI